MNITGARVLVTGGGRGIGAALARSFTAAGARVALVARTAEEVFAVADEIEGIPLVGDVRHEEDCTRVMNEAVAALGGIDILVNNAGIALNKPFTEHSEEEFNSIMDTNVKGVFLMTRAAFIAKPHIILTISSSAGKMGYPGLSVYSASKFAVRGLMQSLAQETHAHIYTVLPGGTDTRLYQELYDARARVKPEQVADAVVALCQEEPPSGFELELYSLL